MLSPPGATILLWPDRLPNRTFQFFQFRSTVQKSKHGPPATYREYKCPSRRSSVSLAKYPPHLGALSSPAGPSGWSRGLNRPRLRYCKPTRRLSNSSRLPSDRPDVASIRAPGDSGERTCRNTSRVWRGGKPGCATKYRRSGWDTNYARQKGGAPRSAYSTANKG